jgi:hypothetical protein
MAYDRDPSTKIVDCGIPLQPRLQTSRRSYEESMYTLCRITLDILHRRVLSLEPEAWLTEVSELKARLDLILVDGQEHLRDVEKCRSIQNRLEHLALRLHLSFITSKICRRAFLLPALQEDVRHSIIQTCVEELKKTLGAFLDMNRLSTIASTAWEFLHRTLSSALLLGIIGRSAGTRNASSLLEHFIEVLSSLTQTTSRHNNEIEDLTQYVSALTVLKRLRDEESCNQTSMFNSSLY